VAGLIEALRPVVLLVLGALLELVLQRARPTSENADPDIPTRDKLRDKVHKHWSNT